MAGHAKLPFTNRPSHDEEPQRRPYRVPTRLAVIVMNIAEQVLLEEGDTKLHMGIEVVATRPCHLSLPASVLYVLLVSKYSYSAHGSLGTDIAHSICESPSPPLIHIPSAIKAMHNTTKLLIPSGPLAPPSPSIPIKSEARGRPQSLTRTLRSS